MKDGRSLDGVMGGEVVKSRQILGMLGTYSPNNLLIDQMWDSIERKIRDDIKIFGLSSLEDWSCL